MFKWCSVGIKGPSVPENPLHHYTITTKLDQKCYTGWIHTFMLFRPNSESYWNQDSFCWMNFGEPVQFEVSVLLADRIGILCGRLLLLQGSVSCTFTDVLLHIWVVTDGYLSYYCLTIRSKPFLLWPVTSTRHLHPENCHSLDSFLFFGPSPANPRHIPLTEIFKRYTC